MKRRYGLLGLLSMIGVLGIATQNPPLYPFVAFALFFEYFFVVPDEMFIEHIRKAGAWAFFANLAAVTVTTCCGIVVKQPPDAALLNGIGTGFGISLIVFSFASAWFDWKGQRGISND